MECKLLDHFFQIFVAKKPESIFKQIIEILILFDNSIHMMYHGSKQAISTK